MASFSEQELQQACSLLQAEFPDTPRSVLERVLRECDLELPVARRKLLELQPQVPAQQTGTSYGGLPVRLGSWYVGSCGQGCLPAPACKPARLDWTTATQRVPSFCWSHA